MNVRRFPKRSEKGCQNRRPQPQRRNKYPVPWLRAATETPEDSESGTRTEYVTALE
jgi:hypothetical protein